MAVPRFFVPIDLAPDAAGRERDRAQSLALIALRALGLPDARARGLVVQTVVGDR